MLDVEFIQLLQDMIGDLTSAPEPIAIKLFSQDPALLRAVGAAGRRGDQETARAWSTCSTASRTPSAARRRCSRSIQAMAARAGFTPQEIELDVERDPAGRAGADAGGAQRPRVHDPRALPRVDPRIGRRDQEHAAGQRDGAHRHARHAATVEEHPGSDRGPAREPAAQRDGHRAARRRRPRRRRRGGAARDRRASTCRRRSAWSTAALTQEQQRSFHDLLLVLVLAIAPRVHRAAVRVRRLRGADRGHRVRPAVDRRRVPRAARHAARRSTCRRSWA